MEKKIEFYFDFGSPNTYLAYFRLPEILARSNAELIWRPMLLGGVFKATGNASPVTIPAKGEYVRRVADRYIARYKIPFKSNPHFPVNTLNLMRGAVAHQMRPGGNFEKYLTTCFTGMWVKPRNLSEPEEIRLMLAEDGFDPDQYSSWIGDQDVKDRLIELTNAAVERGVFGAPTFFVGDEMYFGQDTLNEVERNLNDNNTV